MNSIQLLGALELGLIYGLVAIGVYLTFRVIDFPDMTVDGSFPLGAAVAITMVTAKVDPLVATLAAVIAGAGAGVITAYMNVKWDILGLLAGILTMTALYSINLRIMGLPNIAVIDEVSLFTGWEPLLVVILFAVTVLVATALLLKSDLGLAIRAVGINSRVSKAYGVKIKRMKIIALAVSNAIVALAGALFAQMQGFADISMGTGTIVIGLVSVIIGEVIFARYGLIAALLGCIVGSIAYRIIVVLALNSNITGLHASDLNLVTAILVTVIMIIMKIKKKV